MTGPHLPRRTLLGGLCATVSAATAGCAASLPTARDSTPVPPDYDHLRRTPTYVADGVTLSLPHGVPRIATPADAALIVLPADTHVAAATAVEWWVAGRGIALVGSAAERTFFEWHESDAYYAAFDPPHGSGDSSPNPELLVSFAVGREYVTTYRYTWGNTDDPSDNALLESLEEALAGEAEDGRPRGRGTASTVA